MLIHVAQCSQKNKMCLGIAFLLLLIVALTGCRENDLNRKKLVVERYLKSKYGKTFIVEHIKSYYESVGAPITYKAFVHPVDDTDLTFNVSIRSNEVFEDYLPRLWGHQIENKIIPILKTSVIYCTVDRASTGLNLDFTPTIKEIKDKKNNPELTDEIKSGMHLFIGYGFFVKQRGSKSNSYLARYRNTLLPIVKKLKDKKFNDVTLGIYFFDPKYQNNIDGNVFTKANTQKSKYFGIVIVDNINTVNNWDDFIKQINIPSSDWRN